MSWPQELRKPHVLANFKKRGRKEPKQKRRAERRPGMSADHAALIRQCPCAVCPATPAGTIHHLKSGTGERGMALRSTDRWGVPLCMIHHDEVERVGTKQETTWFASYGIDSHALAQSLWASTGDLGAMIRIVQAHKSSSAESLSLPKSPDK